MLVKAKPKPLRWQRDRYTPLERQMDVFTAAGKFMFYLWWDGKVGNNSETIRRRRARWLVKTMLDLGPTFIKIGQSLSTRADLLPVEYVDALAELQDRVPAFSTETAIAIIESELGSGIYALYRDFEPIPLAAASLGQVHKARLQTGEYVVVKVQRPGLKKLFDIDVKAVYKVMRFFQRVFPWMNKYDLDDIYREFFKILYQEIDYHKEAENAERFRQNFGDVTQVLVPQVYWKYSTTKVLTLEYLPGIKIDDRAAIVASGLDPNKINQMGVFCYLKQLLLDGFFQADPHPGNLALSQDCQLIFYDFGMMCEIQSLAKDEMVRSFFAVLRKDTDEVLDTLIKMGLIERVANMTPVKRTIAFLLDKFTEKPIDFQTFNEIKDELYLMFEQQPFRLPAEMMFVMKSLTTLDGIARALDPEYNFAALAQPFVTSITVSKGGAIGEIARQARKFVKYKLQQPSNTEILLQRFEERIEMGELQVRVRSPESDRALKRIYLALKSLIYACLTGFSFLAGAVLLAVQHGNWAIAAFIFSGLWFVLLLRSFTTLAAREKLDRLAEK